MPNRNTLDFFTTTWREFFDQYEPSQKRIGLAVCAVSASLFLAPLACSPWHTGTSGKVLAVFEGVPDYDPTNFNADGRSTNKFARVHIGRGLWKVVMFQREHSRFVRVTHQDGRRGDFDLDSLGRKKLADGYYALYYRHDGLTILKCLYENLSINVSLIYSPFPNGPRIVGMDVDYYSKTGDLWAPMKWRASGAENVNWTL